MPKHIYILTCILLFVSGSASFAQNQIQISPNLDTLVSKHIEYKLNYPPQGFRLVLFVQSGNHSKNACNEAKNTFLELYPLENAYIIYDEPYFKLKVGNFRTRMEAQRFLEELKGNYPQAYIVKDTLDLSVFLDTINPSSEGISVEELPFSEDAEF